MDTPWWSIDGAPTPDEWVALFAGLTPVATIIAAVLRPHNPQ